MKTPCRFSLLCLAAVILATFGTANPSPAQSVSPVPAPTIITSAPYTINASGYYQLGANINYNGTGAANEAIITINASNVTLDFAGHYIAGPTNNPGTKLYGVYANERANVVIQNGTISYCSFSMYLIGNGNADTNHRNTRVLNMTLTKCYYSGGLIYAAITPEISGCRVSSIGGSTAITGTPVGLDVSGSTGSKVSNCSVANVAKADGTKGYGIFAAAYALDNQITNCGTGLFFCGKYKGNLTYGCTTPFSNGTAVGDNN